MKKAITIIFWGSLIIGGIFLLNQSNTTPSYEYEDNHNSTESYNYQDEGEYEESDSFHGYECTDDCSGHEAGYNWAEENDIDDEYDCNGNSNSFNEGCRAYVEENY